MNFLDNLALKYKLIIPLAVMVAVFAGVLVNAINSIVEQRQKTEQIIEHVDPAMVLLTRANLDMQGMGYDLYRILSYPENSPQMQGVVAAYPSLGDKGTQRFNEAEAVDPDDMAQIDVFKARYTALVAEMTPLEQQAQQVTGFTVGSKATPAEEDATAAVARQVMPVDAEIDTFYADMHQYIDARQAANLAATTALAAKTQSEIWSMIIVGVAAMVGGVGLFLWIISTRVVSPLLGVSNAMSGLASGRLDTVVRGEKRRDEVGHMARAVLVFKENALKTQALEQEAEAARKRQEEERVRQEAMRAELQRQQEQVVNELADGLSKLSRGDLLTRLDTPFAADYERLRGDFNAAMDRLQDTMRSITGSTHSVSAASSQISTAADDLSQRTERQAANLEETAAALDQITAAVKKTAENSDGARQAVAGAKNDAESSGAVMRSAVEAMTGIEHSTREISNILSVIDEIAFQTNLLALNAGVEAARAGDAGRGFAVVATEVRALAQRSADAAKEIKTLIVNSNKQVDAGVKLVGETGEALTRIAEQVTTLNNLIGDIAASAKEQSSGLEQVNTAVNQMDQVTQQNAAMVEEATAASRGLMDDAQELSKLVGQFQIGAMATTARETKPVHKPVPAPGAKPAPKAVARSKTPPRQAALQSAGGDGDWDEF